MDCIIHIGEVQYPIAEIEYQIINYLDPFVDFKQLFLVNKYYCGTIMNNKVYIALKQFYSNKPATDFPTKNLKKEEIIFILACQHNHLLVAKYLLHKYNQSPSTTINISAKNELAFGLVCKNGHLEVAKWLYSLGIELNSHININADDRYALRFACQNGHLEVAKWLHSLEIEFNINIQIYDYEDAFELACENGQLEVAKWLYNLPIEFNVPIDIHWEYEFIFRYTCENGHLKVAKWLYCLGKKTNSPTSVHNCNKWLSKQSRKYPEITNWLRTLQ